jgi:hypothetical protein
VAFFLVVNVHRLLIRSVLVGLLLVRILLVVLVAFVGQLVVGDLFGFVGDRSEE